MKREEKLLSGLNVRNSTGLEIGPLCSPVVLKEDGKVIYVDYTDAETLRKKYRDDVRVDVEKIAEVDAIWGENTLQQALGEGKKVDYIIASHVIEHVPDLITWLHELRTILNIGGEVRLVVPDRRFTFDYLRQESRLSDVLNAHLLVARKPLPQLILDFLLNKATVDTGKAWDGQIEPDLLSLENSFESSINAARDALENGTYHDVHCWVFTPKSFAGLFGKLAEAGLIDFACERFYDTEKYQFEFFVVLRTSDDKAWIRESWRRMADAAQEDVPGSELAARRALSDTLDAERRRIAEAEADLRQAREHALFLSSQLEQAQEHDILLSSQLEQAREQVISLSSQLEQALGHAILLSSQLEQAQGSATLLSSQLERAQEESVNTQQQLRQVEAELRTACQCIARIEKSRSWRITRPLREIGRVFRRQRDFTRRKWLIF